MNPLNEKLYVLCMIENPMRWKSRYRNYFAFENHIGASGGILYTAEVAFGRREFEITEADNPRHLQLQTDHEVWHKENALNLLMSRLPADARYVAWVDADIIFGRPDWVQETLQQLQHYAFVQMFGWAQDLDSNHHPVGKPMEGTICKWLRYAGLPAGSPELLWDEPMPGFATESKCYYSFKGHPGYAWAARREDLDRVGGLFDVAVLGSGDWNMAAALIGDVERSIYDGYSPGYKAAIREWAKRCDQWVKTNVGYVPGMISHMWHGPKSARQYTTRHKFLERSHFDPNVDLKRDWQGLFQLSGNNEILREGIRSYNRGRNEDAA